jgi:hypothetical protein
MALLAEIEGECRVALEATYGWEVLADALQDAGYELHLAHLLPHRFALTRMRSARQDPRRCDPGHERHHASLQRPQRPGRHSDCGADAVVHLVVDDGLGRRLESTGAQGR